MQSSRAMALTATLLGVAAQQLNTFTWGNTAFSPLSAAVQSFTPNVNLSSFAPNSSSARFTGTIATAQADLISFSLRTDGGVLLWVDDHLVIDSPDTFNSVRTVNGLLAVPFLTGVAQTFRLDYLHYSGASTLELSWKGNFTAAGVVPASAFTPAVTAHEQQRIAMRDRMQNPPQPWQTFNNPTMGCHVLMPQSFAVDATLADLGTGDVMGNIIVFRRASPAITYVGPHSYNGSDYTELRLDRWGARVCTVALQTTVLGAADLYFLATANGTGCDGLALLLTPKMLWNRQGAFAAPTAASLTAAMPGFAEAVTVSAVGAAPVAFAKGGPFSLALPLSAGVVGYATGAGPVPSVAAMQAAIAAAAARQAVALAKWGPDLAPVYEPQAAIIAWNTMFTPYEGVVTPVSRGWDFGSGYVLFDWDNYFLAYMASLDAESLDVAFSNLIQTTQMRTLEGFVPNFGSGQHLSYDRTEPQIGAFVALQVYTKWGDAAAGWVVDVIFDALLSWNAWVWDRRRGEGSLVGPDGRADLIVLGSDPNAAPGGIDGGSNNLQAARYESGLDNSPMYDGNDACDGTAGPVCFDNVTTHHMGLYDVGMTGLYLSDTQALMALATARGRPEVLPALQARYDRVNAALAAHLWDDAADEGGAGMYTNALYNGSFYRRYSPTSFFPLISGAATQAQADAAMVWAASPQGFCLNTSYTPDPAAAMLQQWWDGSHDNAACLSDACTVTQVNDKYAYIRVEGVGLAAAAGPAPGRVPLFTWFSASRGDNALTTNGTAPPDAAGGYTLVGQEGWCWDAPPPPPAAGMPWGATELTLWYSASRGDYQACGSPHCLADVSQGYARVGHLCYAYNGTGAANMPCKFGGNSIARSDAAFFDNDYWRGRIWGPHLQLIYWGLAHPAYRDRPAVKAARTSLVAQGRALLLQEWAGFRQVTENYQGVCGIGEDVGNADPFYTWGALPGFLSFLEAGAY